MTTPTPGTIPALTPYQPAALPLAGTEAVEIASSLNATAAVSGSMLLTDIVGKTPSVMTTANPASNDLIAFYKVSSGLPFSSPISNLAVAFGNVPIGGTVGQLLAKNSSTNFDASWFGLSSFLVAGANVTLSGSTTLTIAVSTVATSALPGPFQIGNFTANGVVYGNGTSPLGASAAGTAGWPLLGNGSSVAPGFQQLDLGTGVTSVLPVLNGGLGTSTISVAGILYASSSTVVGITAAGATSLPLVGNGAGPPAFTVLPVAGGGSGTTAGAAFGSVYANGSTAYGITAAGATALPLVSSGPTTAPSFAVVTVPGGGLGTATLPLNGVLVGNTTGPISVVAATTAGLVLTAQGTAAPPIWSAAGAGTVTGPGSATVNDIAVFNSSSGVPIADSGFTVVTAGNNFGHGDVNIIRNAALDIWQRGTTITIGTAGAYGPDGFIILPSGATTTIQRATGRGPTLYSVKVLGTTSMTGLVVKQRIESAIAARCASAVVTFQAQIFCTLATTITPTITIGQATSADLWTGTTVVVNAANLQACASGQWTLVSYAFNGPAAAGNGLEFLINFGNNFAASTSFIQMAEIDARVTPGIATGQVATANMALPELRGIGKELLVCQRYFATSFPNMVAPVQAFGTAASGNFYISIGGTPATIRSGSFLYPAQMRVAPTQTLYNPQNANAQIFDQTTSSDASASVTNATNVASFRVSCTAPASGATGDVLQFGWSATAEL